MENQLTIQNNDFKEQNNPGYQIVETVENNDNKEKVVTSRPGRSKYVVWNKNDGGSDNLTPIERLIYFLLMNGGDNLDLYIGNQEENKVVGRTRAAVIQNCVDYFKERGIKVTASSVRSKINIILETGPEYNNPSDTKSTGKSREECEGKKKETILFYIITEIFLIYNIVSRKIKPSMSSILCDKRNVELTSNKSTFIYK